MTRSSVKTPSFISTQVTDARYFFLNLSPPGNSKLTLVCGGREACRPDYRIRRRGFPWYSLELVVGGRGEVRLGQVHRPLCVGVMYSYGPAVRHDITNNLDDPLVKYFVCFTGRDARGLLRQAKVTPGTSRRLATTAEPADILEAMIRNGSSHTAQSSAICTKLLEVLCLKLAEIPEQVASHTGRAYETYLRCRRELEQRCLTLRTLDELAERCQIDPAYLCRLFKQFDRQSPYQLLTRMKMHHAAVLLMRPGRLVKQVAKDVGFEDPFHFCRAFKRVHGISPRAFLQR